MSTKKTNAATNEATNAATNEATNAATNEATNAATNEAAHEVITANVTKVMLPQGSDNRITFVIDTEFKTLDFATGEEKLTNMFGLNIFAVVNQVAQFVPEIQLADTLALGNCVNPQIVALALTNATITIKREVHEKGEQRKNTSELYARDCITSEIVKVSTNIKPIFAQMLMQLVTTAPAIVQKADIPNPFGL